MYVLFIPHLKHFPIILDLFCFKSSWGQSFKTWPGSEKIIINIIIIFFREIKILTMFKYTYVCIGNKHFLWIWPRIFQLFGVLFWALLWFHLGKFFLFLIWHVNLGVVEHLPWELWNPVNIIMDFRFIFQQFCQFHEKSVFSPEIILHHH